MPVDSTELVQRVRKLQAQLESVMGVAELPRALDRVQVYKWGAVPLTWEGPRFGAVEYLVAEPPRRGWQVILAKALQEEPEHVVNWVMWREAFLALLLPHVRQVQEVADLGLYAGLRLGGFSKEVQKALTTMWERVSPPQHYVHYIYDAPYGFPLFDGVVDGVFLKSVVSWLNGFRVSGVVPLSSASYTAALEQWMLETHIPLTVNEVRILSVLANTTQFKQKELAKQLDMLPSALSPALAKLAQRHILRLYNFTNLPSIGLIPFEIIIRIKNPKNRVKWVDLFSGLPYTSYVTTIHDTIVGRILIPHDREVEFSRWVDQIKLNEEISSTSKKKVIAILDHWNFSQYIAGIGWVDDFSLIMEKTRSFLHNSQLTDSLISKYQYGYDQDLQKLIDLRTEDFIYFRRAIDTVFVSDRVSPQLSQEIREANLSDSAYRRRVQDLEEWNVSVLGRLWLLHIGLNTVIQLLLFEPKETISHFIQALKYFPSITGAVYEGEGARLRIFVPNPQAVEVLSFIRKLTVEQEFAALVEAQPFWKAVTGLQYPVNEANYDFNARSWKWSKSSLPEV